MAELPAGTVTLLFTDVDGSTELVKRLGDRYAAALGEHRALLRDAFAEHGGTEVDTQGDAFFAVFRRAPDAITGAIAGQRALADHRWDEAPVLVRMGLHTGEPHVTEHGYTGLAVHRAARICTIAHGGQILLSRATAGIVDDAEIPGVGLRDRGEHRLKGIDRPERIYQLVVDGLPSEFPPLQTAEQLRLLEGTVTIVMAEGRRMLRLYRQLGPDDFGVLLSEYQRLLCDVFTELGGHETDSSADTVVAVFASARQAALAAVAAQQAVARHGWPDGLEISISAGLHSGEAAVGWAGPAAERCAQLCDTAEGGQIFLSQATASLLEDEDLGELSVRDLGELQTRRTGQTVRAYELVVPEASEPSPSRGRAPGDQ